MCRRGDRHQLGDALHHAEHGYLRIAEPDEPGVDAVCAGAGHKFLLAGFPYPTPASIMRTEAVNLAFRWSGLLWSIRIRRNATFRRGRRMTKLIFTGAITGLILGLRGMRQPAAAGLTEGGPARRRRFSGQSGRYAATSSGDEAPAAKQICHSRREWAAGVSVCRSARLPVRLFWHTTELGCLPAGGFRKATRQRGPDDGDHEPGGMGLRSLGLALISPSSPRPGCYLAASTAWRME